MCHLEKAHKFDLVSNSPSDLLSDRNSASFGTVLNLPILVMSELSSTAASNSCNRSDTCTNHHLQRPGCSTGCTHDPECTACRQSKTSLYESFSPAAVVWSICHAFKFKFRLCSFHIEECLHIFINKEYCLGFWVRSGKYGNSEKVFGKEWISNLSKQ